MPRQNLSPEKAAIVDNWVNKGGPMLVEASAGSGKTRVLTESVREILERTPRERFRILCLTFTNKAADEMRERLADVKGIKERTFIGTTHAFALEILKSRRHELGLDDMPQIIDKEADRKAILTQAILSNPLLAHHYLHLPDNNLYDSLPKYQTDFLSKCLTFISRQKQRLIWLDEEVNSYPGWTRERVRMYQDYNALLRSQNLIDYDDILLMTWRILSEREAVANLYRRLYKYVLVDEAQDLSFAQYELIRTFCIEHIQNVMLVGDPKQAIHGYAGASSQFMKERFVEDFELGPGQQMPIQYNYRSSKAITSLANNLSGNGQDNSENYFSGKIEFLEFSDERNEAAWIIQKIHQVIGTKGEAYDGELTLDKIAILGRNRFVFKELEKALSVDEKLCNQFFLKRGTEVLEPESSTMKVFDLGTRILSNRRAYVYVNQLFDLLAINQEQCQFLDNEKDSLALLSSALSIQNNSLLPKSLSNALLSAWEKIEIDINKLPNILEVLIDEFAAINADNERSLALQDLEEWREAWTKYVRSVPANAKSMADFRRFLAMGTQSKKQAGLTLATVHTVKGLEFYIVFLIGVGDGTFPDYRAVGKNELAEERNNAYVAVTRAKRDLYVSYPKLKKAPWGTLQQEKSRFFSNQPFQSVETLASRG